MKAFLISLSLSLVALGGLGCSKDAPPPEAPPTTEPAPAAGEPAAGEPATPPAGEPGADPRQDSPGKPMVCKTDADCVASCQRKMECCDQLCPPCNQAFHKLDLEANTQWRGGHCAQVSCPMAKCKAPTEESVAVCKAGTCLVEKRPLASP